MDLTKSIEIAELPPHLTYMVLEKCSVQTLFELCICSSILHNLCLEKNILLKKLREITFLSGTKLEEQSFTELKAKDISHSTWENIFTFFSPYIRWNDTPIFVDQSIPIYMKIERVTLTKNNMMRVDVPGGFITYQSGEEIFTTPNRDVQGPSDLHYTEHYLVLRKQNKWFLSDYSLREEHVIISELKEFNLRTKGRDIVHIVTHENDVVALYTDRLVVYNWREDRVVFDVKMIGGMKKIIPDYMSDGRIIRLILKSDELDNKYVIVNPYSQDKSKGIAILDAHKNCRVFVPIFQRNIIWTLDQNGRQTSFSMVEPTKIMSEVSEPMDIKQAIYVDSISRMVTISQSGRAEVGEIDDIGKFIRCGTLDYGDIVPFNVTEMVSGPKGIALVGSSAVRYITFEE